MPSLVPAEDLAHIEQSAFAVRARHPNLEGWQRKPALVRNELLRGQVKGRLSARGAVIAGKMREVLNVHLPFLRKKPFTAGRAVAVAGEPALNLADLHEAAVMALAEATLQYHGCPYLSFCRWGHSTPRMRSGGIARLSPSKHQTAPWPGSPFKAHSRR